MKLRYTLRARHDLAEIHDHIARKNRQVARKIVSLIRKEAERLQTNPAMGRLGRVAETRELVIGRYPFIVVYTVAVKEIQLLAAVHTSRLWPDLF